MSSVAHSMHKTNKELKEKREKHISKINDIIQTCKTHVFSIPILVLNIIRTMYFWDKNLKCSRRTLNETVASCQTSRCTNMFEHAGPKERLP